MSFPVQMGPSRNPDCPVFCQKPARVLWRRFLCFRNPPLKSEACAKSQNPDCAQSKRFLGSRFLSANTTSYARVQNPDLPPPKGEGVLPAKRGGDTSFPWARLRLRSWCAQATPRNFSSDDGGPYRQAHDHRRLPPEQPTQKKETTHG